MYSYEDRKQAVELYIQYNLSAAAAIRELGYPDRHTLVVWYKEFMSNGELKKQRVRSSKYSPEQRKSAIEYYLSHGKNMNQTIQALGYPGRATLSAWLAEDCPEEKRYCKHGAPEVYLTQEQREWAAIDMCTRTGSAQEIADKYHVSRYTVYNCKRQLFGKGVPISMPQKPSGHEMSAQEEISELQAEIDILRQEKEDLSRQVYRLQLERDVLTVASEVPKKRPGRQSSSTDKSRENDCD